MLPTSTIGRKLVMAVTGQMMVLFIIAHVAGNSTIFFGKLNAYAAAIHALPLLQWTVRLVMFGAVSIHIFYAVQLTLENSAAQPGSYVSRDYRASTFAGRNMVWTGSVIGTFLVYHLLHFTFQVIEPTTAAYRHADALGRPDVFLMVARSLRKPVISAVYLTGVAMLWLHLSHGIQSSFQTFGLNSERSFPVIRKTSSFAAVVLLLAYASIPVALVVGLLLR